MNEPKEKGVHTMETRRIIPALDIQNGRVVSGIQYVNIRDAGDPVEATRYYCEQGADELVMLDIDASHEGRGTVLEVAAQIAGESTIPVCAGGGVSSLDHIHELLNVGVDKVFLNSAAVRNPELIEEAAKRFGSKSIVVAIDVKRENGQYAVYISGGRIAAEKNPVEWAIEMERRGAGEILLTSMDNDGVEQGYDLTITRQVADAVGIPVIASGGAGKLEDFSDAVREGHADAMLAASLFHFRKLEVRQVKEYLQSMGIPVRL